MVLRIPRIEMMNYAGESPLDLDALRARLAKMTDAELQRFGKAAAYMADPVIQGREVREVYVIQLAEVRAEWKRRNPPKLPA